MQESGIVSAFWARSYSFSSRVLTILPWKKSISLLVDLGRNSMPENKHYLYLKMNDVAHAVVAAFSIFSLKFPSNISKCFRIQSTTKISQLIQHVKSICIDHYRTCDKRMSPVPQYQ